MLTKDDLQAIRGVVKEEIDISIKKELKPINRRLNKLDKKLDLVIKTFDNEIIDHELRITHLEENSSNHASVN